MICFISTNKYVKYVGVLFDDQLSWKHYTDFVVNIICIAVGVFPILLYEVKVKSLRNVCAKSIQSIAAIHSYNTRQATTNKYYHPRLNKKEWKCQ